MLPPLPHPAKNNVVLEEVQFTQPYLNIVLGGRASSSEIFIWKKVFADMDRQETWKCLSNLVHDWRFFLTFSPLSGSPNEQ